MGKGICLVLGMHRSGTSLISRCMAGFGVAHGNNLLVNADNAKGHWEDLDLVELNQNLLKKLHQSWASLTVLTKQHLEQNLQEEDQETARALVLSRLVDHQFYALKDPRTTILLPFWLPILDSLQCSLRIVLCIRHPEAVVKSLAQRDAFHRLRSLALWIKYNLAAIEALSNSPHNLVIIEYDEMLAQPDQQLERMGKILQLERDETTIKTLLTNFIDPSLNHHSMSGSEATRIKSTSDPILALAIEIYTHLITKLRADSKLDEQTLLLTACWKQKLESYLALAPLCDEEFTQKKKAEQARDELIVIYKTLSWKITRPLRWLRSISIGMISY